MPTEQLVYWDSDVFISRIARTAGRIETLEQITDAAENRELRIVASTLSLAEVAKVPELGLLPEAEEQLIVDFFENEYITVLPLDWFVAEEARRIVREHGLKPPDAVHVATAILANVPLFNTYEHKMRGKDRQIGDPPLRIEEPRGLDQGKMVFDAADENEE